MSAWRLWVVLALAAVTAGCSGFESRRGLKPVLSAADVAAASSNKSLLLRALAVDAGIIRTVDADFASLQPLDWYYVARSGFNVVDDQCKAYFDELFFLNRGREQIKSGISAAGQTAAALLSITGAPALSLGVLAQAVGLGVTTTELVAGTYLYELPPATTHGFVQKLQFAFRDEAARRHVDIATPEAAYYMIQRYLDLCLPPRIEAEIARQIASAGAVGVSRGQGALFTLETYSAPSAGLEEPAAGPAPRARPPIAGTRGVGAVPGRFTEDRRPEASCTDNTCRELTRYLFDSGGRIIADRRRYLTEQLTAIDPQLADDLIRVIQVPARLNQRTTLLARLKAAPAGTAS